MLAPRRTERRGGNQRPRSLPQPERRPKFRGWDLNPRPAGYEPAELTTALPRMPARLSGPSHHFRARALLEVSQGFVTDCPSPGVVVLIRVLRARRATLADPEHDGGQGSSHTPKGDFSRRVLAEPTRQGRVSSCPSLRAAKPRSAGFRIRTLSAVTPSARGVGRGPFPSRSAFRARRPPWRLLIATMSEFDARLPP